MRNAFIKTLSQLARDDKRITLITGDLGFGVLTDFAKTFPKQFFNAGVAEQNMTGLATGLALEGRIVFTYSIANFSTLRCLEQIRNDAAYHNCNVNVVAVGGGFSYGQLGFSHHATEDLSILRALPEISVYSPCDAWEVEQSVHHMVKKSGTGYIRLDRSGPANLKSNDPFIPGRPRVVRDGKDLTIVATGGIIEVALKVADDYAKKGVDVRVLSLHTLRPFDPTPIIKAAKETKGIITLEEQTVHGGLGGLIAENLMELGVTPKKFYRLGLRAGFTTIVGDQNYLREYYGVGHKALTEKVSEMLQSP
jgi:transketolase